VGDKDEPSSARSLEPKFDRPAPKTAVDVERRAVGMPLLAAIPLLMLCAVVAVLLPRGIAELAAQRMEIERAVQAMNTLTFEAQTASNPHDATTLWEGRSSRLILEQGGRMEAKMAVLLEQAYTQKQLGAEATKLLQEEKAARWEAEEVARVEARNATLEVVKAARLEAEKAAWLQDKERLEAEKMEWLQAKARLEAEKAAWLQYEERLEAEKAGYQERLEAEKAGWLQEKARLEEERLFVEQASRRLEAAVGKEQLGAEKLSSEQARLSLEQATVGHEMMVTVDTSPIQCNVAPSDDKDSNNKRAPRRRRAFHMLELPWPWGPALGMARKSK